MKNIINLRSFIYSTIAVFCLLSFLFPYQSSAVEDTSAGKIDDSSVISKIKIENAKIISNEDNIIKTSFDLVGGDAVQSGIKYGIRLIKKTSSGSYIYDEKVYEEEVQFNAGTSTSREVIYTPPSSLYGKYNLMIVLGSKSGATYSMQKLGDVDLVRNENVLEVLTDTCYLEIPGDVENKKYKLNEGVDISVEELLVLNCSVLNRSAGEIQAVPEYETHYRNIYGDIVEADGGSKESVIFSPNEQKIVSVTLPKNKTPQAYDVLFSLKYLNDTTNIVPAHFVVQGKSATISSVSIDKKYYKKGDSYKLSIVWAKSADSFQGSRAGSSSAGKDIFLEASIKNSVGKNCSAVIKENLSEKGDIISLGGTIEKDCINPEVFATIKDSAGVTLAEYSVYIDSDIVDKEGSNLILYLVLGLFILLIIIILIIFKAKKNIISKEISDASTKLGLFFLFFLTSWMLFFPVNIASAKTTLISNIDFIYTMDNTYYHPYAAISVSGATQNHSCTNSSTYYTKAFIVGYAPEKTFSGNVGTTEEFDGLPVGDYTMQFEFYDNLHTYLGEDYMYFHVVDPPDPNLSVSPTSVSVGSSATISWNPTGSNSCAAYGDWTGAKSTSGGGTQSTGNLTAPKSYGLECVGPLQEVSETVNVDVICNTGPAGYTKCANENGTCSVSAQSSVAYGCVGSFNYKEVTGNTSCDSTTFGGDPIGGTVKACFKKAVYPDLVASPESGAGSTVNTTVGNSVSLSSTIRNKGDGYTIWPNLSYFEIKNASQGGGSTIAYEPPGQDYWITEKYPGDSQSMSRSYTFNTAGTYSYRARVDKNNDVSNESNESNNYSYWTDIVVSLAPINGVCNNDVVDGCSAGALNASSPADTTTANNWSCNGQYGGTSVTNCTKPKVNGVCDNSTINGCSAGTLNASSPADTTTANNWSCLGIDNGTDATNCTKPKINGSCNNAIVNGCSAGTLNASSPADTTTANNWSCLGIDNGTDATNCTKPKVNGVCNNTVINGCSAGTLDANSPADTTTASNWSCNGSDNGTNATDCTKLKTVPSCNVLNSPTSHTGSPIAASLGTGGVAGSITNVKYGGSGTVPTNVGTYAITTDFAPTDTNTYAPLSGASCGSFVITNAPVNGVCDNSAVNGCSPGTLDAANPADTTTANNWSCNGQYGGTSVTNCTKPKVNGVCDNSTINGCSAGTLNASSPADTTTANNWSCLGIDNGTDATNCTKLKTVPSCNVLNSPTTHTGSPIAASLGTGGVAGSITNVKYGGSGTVPTNVGTYAITTDFAPTDTNTYAPLSGASCGNFVITNAPVNGVCNNTAINGCSAGTLDANSPADTTTANNWSCNGQYGGTSVTNCTKPKVNGVCDNSTINGCSAGTLNASSPADTTTANNWSCLGIDNGTDATNCTKPKINGSCNNAVVNGCSVGTLDASSPADTTTANNWSCNGSDNGTNATDCTKPKVNGVCNNTVIDGCSAGTLNASSPADTTTANNWSCLGIDNGTDATNCTKPKVNGVCDNIVVNGCTTGTLDASSPADTTTANNWSCLGSFGGTDATNCTKPKINGSCNNAIVNGCSAGTLNASSPADTTTANNWSCLGIDNGTDATNCTKPKVNGVCNNTVINGCSAGTLDASSPADTTTASNWSCNGSDNGTNATDCTKLKTVPSCNVLNSPTSHTGSPIAASLGTGGVAGSITNVKYGGSGTVPTNVGTYAITTDFAPTDTNTYAPLSGASCGNFVITNAPVNGVCDNSAVNGCSPGTLDAANPADTTTANNWSCLGSSGGTNATNCTKPKVNGVCDNSTINGCSAGTLNASSPADTTTANNWSCLGIDNGTDATNCTKLKTVPSCNVLNSPTTHTGSPIAASLGTGGVAGSITNVKYGGSGTVPTNVGTYAITTDFAPTDTNTYAPLSGASCGNFVISKADQSIALADQSIINGGSFTPLSTTGGSGTGSVTYAVTTAGAGCSVSGTTLNYSTTGFCVVTATKASDANYNSASDLGTFTVNSPGDSCGAGSSATPQLTEPGGASACTAGTYANSPADTTTSGLQAWNWSCGTVTNCSAPKYGCRIPYDSNYDLAQYGASGPNNDYGCASTCENGGTNYAGSCPTYTITFNGNGSDGGSTASQTIPQGVTENLNANGFTRSGYNFQGWATTAGGSAAYSDGGSYTMGSANVTLYAKWTQGDTCGAGSSATPQSSEPSGASACAVGTYANSPADTTTSGSQAWNWSCGTVTNCSAPKYGCRITYDSNYDLAQYGASGPNNDYGCASTCENGGTNYAGSCPTYTITFNGNGSDGGSTASQTIPQGVTENLNANGFTRSGYNFQGWATTAGGSAIYGNGGSYTMGSANVTLYAKWNSASPAVLKVNLYPYWTKIPVGENQDSVLEIQNIGGDILKGIALILSQSANPVVFSILTPIITTDMAVNEVRQFIVRYQPTAVGPADIGTINVNTSNGGNEVVDLSAQSITIASGATSFPVGDVPVGVSRTFTYKVKNNSETPRDLCIQMDVNSPFRCNNSTQCVISTDPSVESLFKISFSPKYLGEASSIMSVGVMNLGVCNNTYNSTVSGIGVKPISTIREL